MFYKIHNKCNTFLNKITDTNGSIQKFLFNFPEVGFFQNWIIYRCFTRKEKKNKKENPTPSSKTQKRDNFIYRRWPTKRSMFSLTKFLRNTIETVRITLQNVPFVLNFGSRRRSKIMTRQYISFIRTYTLVLRRSLLSEGIWRYQ